GGRATYLAERCELAEVALAEVIGSAAPEAEEQRSWLEPPGDARTRCDPFLVDDEACGVVRRVLVLPAPAAFPLNEPVLGELVRVAREERLAIVGGFDREEAVLSGRLVV